MFQKKVIIYLNKFLIKKDELKIEIYDFMFIFHEVTIDNIIKNYGHEYIISIIKEKPAFIQLDCSIWKFTQDARFMSYFNAIGVAHLNSFNKIIHNNKYLIYNASIKRSEVVKNGNNSIVYIGRIKDKNKIEKIIRFSEHFKIPINLYTFDIDEIEKIKNNNYIFFKGSLPYDELYTGINNNNYGLCFKGSESPCGKIFDYISYGLPVLYEQGLGEADLIKEHNMGQEFNMNELKLMKFQKFDNHKIYEIVQKKHLWENRINLWVKIIDDIINK